MGNLLHGLLVAFCTLVASCGQTDVEEGQALFPGATATDDVPNILVIIADDLGHADVGSYGNSVVRTPNIDRLSAEGMRFSNAFVPASMCSPSRAAIYSGLYPHRNGLSRNHFAARPNIRSIPHYLTELGYRTALVGKSHVKPFDAFPFERLERNLDDVADYLDTLGGSPFALVIAQHYPHVPWLPNDNYDPSEIPLPEKLLDTPETRMTMARYYSSISAADAEVGELLDLLRNRGLYDRTVVIFLSDHGPQFPFAKFSNYEAGLKVPLVVRWPGVVRPATENSAMLSAVDILPTLIEIAGGTPPVSLDGRSFMPQLKGNQEPVHDAVFATHSTLGLNINDLDPYGIRSIRTSRYRLIRNLHPQNKPRSFISEPRPLTGSIKYLARYGVWVAPGLPSYWKSWLAMAESDPAAAARINAYFNRPAIELYDLQQDPGEMKNLAELPEHADAVAELNRRLICWMMEQGDPEVEILSGGTKPECEMESSQ